MQILLWKSFEYQTLLFTFTFIFVIIFGTRNLKKDEELGEDVKAEEVEKKPLSTSQVLCETCDTFVNVFVQFLFWITTKKYIFIAFKWNENIREKQQKFKNFFLNNNC